MPSAFSDDDQMIVDTPVEDAQSDESDDGFQDPNDRRIKVLPGASETGASFEIDNEDHTLGNSLRYMIMKNPEVELCGYSIPHPSEAKLNLRIQTYEGSNVYDVLEKGLDDLMEVCGIVLEKFKEARNEFDAEDESQEYQESHESQESQESQEDVEGL